MNNLPPIVLITSFGFAFSIGLTIIIPFLDFPPEVFTMSSLTTIVTGS